MPKPTRWVAPPSNWLVDIPARRVTVHRQPQPDGSWADVSVHDDQAFLVLPDTDQTFRVADFLPPAR